MATYDHSVGSPVLFTVSSFSYPNFHIKVIPRVGQGSRI